MLYAFGLIIVGDEMLSGRRQDQHLAKVIALLQTRGLQLAWARYVGDDRLLLTQVLKESFSQNLPVIVTGGIGATPDDHTRQAAGLALDLPLEMQPQAHDLLVELLKTRQTDQGQVIAPGSTVYEHILQMANFPQGARMIPNAFNGVAGFSIFRHHFVPGFPEMAWPMIEWVLDHEYANWQNQHDFVEKSCIIKMVPESQLTPMMEQLEARYDIKVFCLPHLGLQGLLPPRDKAHIELGVKGHTQAVNEAFVTLLDALAIYEPIVLES